MAILRRVILTQAAVAVLEEQRAVEWSQRPQPVSAGEVSVMVHSEVYDALVELARKAGCSVSTAIVLDYLDGPAKPSEGVDP